ncbi:hypothetical protein ACFL5Z_06575 [Planctomycetota bacterium]
MSDSPPGLLAESLFMIKIVDFHKSFGSVVAVDERIDPARLLFGRDVTILLETDGLRHGLLRCRRFCLPPDGKLVIG